MSYPNRKEYEQKLKNLFKINNFYDNQWTVIKKLLNKKSVILIEKTGFGKSLCYQFTATQLEGITLVFSPLISLMRDQINNLSLLNIQGKALYSGQTYKEKQNIISSALNGELKLLYISPEHQESKSWIDYINSLNISMIVIDEAHCISQWGHNFRPSYQNIIKTINTIKTNIPILSTTATANKKTIKDIKSQMGKAKVLRASLDRPSLNLSVVKVIDKQSKFAYIKDIIPKLNGIGLIYSAKRRDTELYSNLINSLNIPSTAYHAGMEKNKRLYVEQNLIQNKYKVVCATNALGMGLDKPDIRFVIHTNITASPMHYYQEIGRAGRDGKKAKVILLYNQNDKNTHENGIISACPNKKDYYLILDALKNGDNLTDIANKTGLSNTILKAILLNMEKKKVIKLNNGKYHLIKYPYRISLYHHLKLKQHRLNELKQMIDYTSTKKCRMVFLRNSLVDYKAEKCYNCDVCLNSLLRYKPSEESINFVSEFFIAHDKS